MPLRSLSRVVGWPLRLIRRIRHIVSAWSLGVPAMTIIDSPLAPWDCRVKHLGKLHLRLVARFLTCLQPTRIPSAKPVPRFCSTERGKQPTEDSTY